LKASNLVTQDKILGGKVSFRLPKVWLHTLSIIARYRDWQHKAGACQESIFLFRHSYYLSHPGLIFKWAAL
jgi:hypothetical protein